MIYCILLSYICDNIYPIIFYPTKRSNNKESGSINYNWGSSRVEL